MISWNGWGILALPIFAVCLLGGTSLVVALGWAPVDPVTGGMPSNIGTVSGALTASVIVWFFGRWLNQPVERFDPRTGAPVLSVNRHRLFAIPMQYLAVVGVGIAVFAAVQMLTR